MKFCETIGQRSVTEFNYRMSDAARAHIFVGLSIAKPGDSAQIAKRFAKAGFECLDLTHDELAKTHVRHMVGRLGRRPGRAALPLRVPGTPWRVDALPQQPQPSWNISLFHYRYQGADDGQILVGIKFPPKERRQLARSPRRWLSYVEETDNPVYRLFPDLSHERADVRVLQHPAPLETWRTPIPACRGPCIPRRKSAAGCAQGCLRRDAWRCTATWPITAGPSGVVTRADAEEQDDLGAFLAGHSPLMQQAARRQVPVAIVDVGMASPCRPAVAAPTLVAHGSRSVRLTQALSTGRCSRPCPSAAARHHGAGRGR